MFESARSLRPGWIGFGWFIAIALTSLVLLLLTVVGLLRPEEPTEPGPSRGDGPPLSACGAP